MSAQAFVDVRSIGVLSGKTSATALISGSLSLPPSAPTVVRMTGTSSAFALEASPSRLFESSDGSMEFTPKATHG
jgi:hypothetical protein